MMTGQFTWVVSLLVLSCILALPNGIEEVGAAPMQFDLAYVAFLCNEAMLLPILVLIRSLKSMDDHGVHAEICIMITNEVPASARKVSCVRVCVCA
jgi:hypothetical protein